MRLEVKDAAAKLQQESFDLKPLIQHRKRILKPILGDGKGARGY